MTAVIYGGERGGEIRHGLERDAAGRLTAKITPETRTKYRYDAADRLLEIRRRQHDAAEGGEPEVIRFSYDSAGNLLSEETAQGVLQHRYDVQGNRTETQMPDGRTLRYLYYGSGHLQQVNLGVMSSASSRVTTCTVRCSGARGGWTRGGCTTGRAG